MRHAAYGIVLHSAAPSTYVQTTAHLPVKKAWKDLTPEQRRKKAERLREAEKARQAERKRMAKKARKQPTRRTGYHQIEQNKDGSYRCLTCIRKEQFE